MWLPFWKVLFPFLVVRFSFAVSCLSSWQAPLPMNRRHLLASLPGVVPSWEFCSWGPGLPFGGKGHVVNTTTCTHSQGPLGPSILSVPSPRGHPSGPCSSGAPPADGISLAEAQSEAADEGGLPRRERNPGALGWAGGGQAEATTQMPSPAPLPASQQQAQPLRGVGRPRAAYGGAWTNIRTFYLTSRVCVRRTPQAGRALSP